MAALEDDSAIVTSSCNDEVAGRPLTDGKRMTKACAAMARYPNLILEVYYIEMTVDVPGRRIERRLKRPAGPIK